MLSASANVGPAPSHPAETAVWRGAPGPILAARDMGGDAEGARRVFGRRTSEHTLRTELAEVAALIAAHPLAAPEVRAAHYVIDSGERGDGEALDRRLAAAGLPSVEELGRTQVSGFWSWWALHRRKRKLERKIARAAGD